MSTTETIDQTDVLMRRSSLDDAYVAHAALVVTGRRPHGSVNRAAEYLYGVADAIGVDCVDLASLIVETSERRACTGRTARTA